MLQNIRNNIQGTAAKIIIGLIIVPFAFFGIDSLFSGGGAQAVAEVNGEKISEEELTQAIALQKRRLISMMGEQFDPAMLEDAVLRKPALNTLIKQELMLQAADEAELAISEQQLNATIASMPQFHENGRFSQSRYEQVLRLQGYSSAMFKQLLRSDLLIQQLSNGMAGSAFVTEAQLARLVALIHETRDYQYIPIPVESFADRVSVGEEEIQSFYEASADRFQSEEKVKLSYLELTEDQFHEPVPEDQIQAEYQRLVTELGEQAEREAAHILVEVNDERSREEAVAALRSVQKRLANGEEFSKLAADVSDDAGSAKQGGALGFSSGDSFPEHFENALANLKTGEVSDIVETDAGLHLIKLVSLRTPEVPALDEVREDIVARLRAQKAEPALVAAVEELRDLVFNAEDLAMPAKRMGLEVKHSDWLTRNAETPLFKKQEVRSAAFDATLRKENLNSEVFEISPKRYVVIHIEDYAAPEKLPLAEVQDEIRKQLVQRKAREMALEKAQTIETALQEGKRAEELAKAQGLKWEAVAAGKRGSQATDASIRNKAFSLPQPEGEAASTGLVQREDKVIVVAVTQVTPGELSSLSQKELKEAKDGILAQKMGRDFSAYFNSLWANAEIDVLEN